MVKNINSNIINKTIESSLKQELDPSEVKNKKSFLLDHITKKKVLDTPSERIRQELELTIMNIYHYPKEFIEVNASINSPSSLGFFYDVDLLIRNDKGNSKIIFKIIDFNQETMEVKKELTRIFKNENSIEFACIYDGVSMNIFSWNNRLINVADLPIYKFINHNSNVLLKEDLVSADKKLKQVFKNIHNYLYANSNIRIASRIGDELVKIILCKIEDEKTLSNECLFFIDIKESNYDNLIRNIDHLWKKVQINLPSYNDEKLNLDNDSLAYVVKQFQKYSFTKTNSDILGESFQIFIDQSRLQDLGAFFTEIQAVKLSMQMLDITIGDNFIDPFQGTGGFIQEFANVMKENFSFSSSKEKDREFNEYCKKNISGIDIEEELIKISEAKMMTVDSIKYNSFIENSLENPDNWALDTQRKVLKDSFSKIGTNPPFGTKISIQSQDILSQYELSKKWSRTKVNEEYMWEQSSDKQKRNPRVPDILGLERVYQLLKTPTVDNHGNITNNGGMAAIVLPRQIFSGPKELYVREWIMRNTIVHAIIDLPTETFQPHTGTKTSILLFSKRITENPYWYKDDSHKIFMSIPTSIGHDRRGLPVYKKDKDGILLEDPISGDYILDSDINEVLESWKEFKAGGDPSSISENAFTININEIDLKDIRLDSSFYNKNASDIISSLYKLPELTNNEWIVEPLGNLVSDVFFPGRFKRNYVDSANGIPFLSGTNISQYIPVNVKYLSKQSKNLEQCLIKEGWILITRSGTTGIVSLAPVEWNDIAVSDHVIRIVPNEKLMNSGYLYVYLKSVIGQAIMKKGIYGSVVDEITPEFIRNIPVAFPKDKQVYNSIGNTALEALKSRSRATNLINKAEKEITDLFNTKS